ncbi:hypothetical protein NPIL_676271 [Nephila pilipes]|uniref:Uncharacterized protein n=1 Tax=Nephila pilipes TaxID=299642 RepID=A0A8X6PRX0_NEPPI|nr:hypothetical protein NPIL_676271 [Nephila pilipes]
MVPEKKSLTDPPIYVPYLCGYRKYELKRKLKEFKVLAKSSDRPQEWPRRLTDHPSYLPYLRGHLPQTTYSQELI